jgi:hypothetical protein
MATGMADAPVSLPPPLLSALDRLIEAATRSELGQIERRVARGLRAAFILQGAAVAKGRHTLHGLDTSLGATREAFDSILADGAERALGLGFAAAAADLDVTLSEAETLPKVRNFRDATAQTAAYVTDARNVRWRSLEATTRARLDGVLNRAASEGWGYARTERAIRREFRDMAGSRAETIARTETANAYESARRIVAQGVRADGEVVEQRWLVTFACCDLCAMNEQAGWLPLDAPYPSGADRPPEHPNCLPGDTLVVAPDIRAATKRRYEGQIIVIRTAGGKRLACTPNHPVLTPAGWVAASSLDVGGYVVGRGVGERAALRVDLDGEDVPARIEDVAEAFGRSEHVTAAPVPTAAEHFHGDGTGSQVAVVWANRLLRDGRDAASGEHRGQRHLTGRGTALQALARSGDGSSVGVGLALAAHGRMGGVGQAGTLFGRCARHAQIHGGASIAGRDAGFEQASPDGRATDAQRRGERFLGLAGLVAADQFGAGHVKPIAPRRYTGQAQALVDERLADAELARDLLGGAAGLVFADQIIGVHRERFEGHVFNLETAGGWYCAEGIITHNCRCSVQYRTAAGGVTEGE